MSRRGAGLAAALLLAGAYPLRAQDLSLNRTGSGARAAGMGNAFIAVSDDGTAASWNPAGLSQLRKPEFSLVHSSGARSAFLEGFRTRDGSAAFTSLGTTSRTAYVEFASAAVPFSVAGKPVTLQAGWRRLYQITSLSRGDVRRIVEPSGPRPSSVLAIDDSSDGAIDIWSLAGAVRFTNRLSVGWAVDLYDGGWQDRRTTSETPGALGPTDFSSVVQTHALSGTDLTLGLLLSYTAVKVGLVYHGAFSGALGDSTVARSNLIDPVDASLGPDARLRFPRSLGLGVAWRPRPLLRLALDVTHDAWTEFVITGAAADPTRSISIFDGLPRELTATRDTVAVNAGLERLVAVRERFVPVRLGAAYEPQAARDPLLRDGLDHFVLSAGTGINTNSVKLDVALEYRWGSFRRTQNLSPVYQVGRAGELGLPPLPEAEGTARIAQWRLKAALIYRVTDTGKVKGLLRRVFGS